MQMRIGGESDPDSDVLQLVAGVKRRCSASHWRSCTLYMHACTRLCPSVFFAERMSLCTSCMFVCVRVCVCSHRFDVCVHVTVHDALKLLHVTWYGGGGGGGSD